MAARKRATRAYHHGDLRQALLDAAMRRLEKEGAESLTLRAVARDAGVSHNAPYHHFLSAGALLAALAAEGLRRLSGAMDARMKTHGGDALRDLQQTGVAYVVFAARHPDLFRLIFGRVPAEDDAELRGAARATFAILQRAVVRCFDEKLIDAATHDARTTALAAWSLTHGLAYLAVDGQLGRRGRSAAGIEAAAEAVTWLFVSSLAARPGSAA